MKYMMTNHNTTYIKGFVNSVELMFYWILNVHDLYKDIVIRYLKKILKKDNERVAFAPLFFLKFNNKSTRVL